MEHASPCLNTHYLRLFYSLLLYQSVSIVVIGILLTSYFIRSTLCSDSLV